MPDFFCVILTSTTCGHCAHTRGNGLLGNGKEYMKYDVIKNLINPYKDNKKINLLNIHYNNMYGKNSMIIDISKIYLKGETVYQEKYYNDNGKTKSKTLSLVNTKVQNISEENVSFNGSHMNWEDFVAKRVPKNLENYTYFYPCFLVINKKDWEVSIHQKTELVAIANAGRTIKNPQGKIELEKNTQMISKTSTTPNSLIKGVFEGSIKIKPHNEPEKTTDNIESKNLSKPKTTTKCGNFGFVIKSFE